MAEPGPLDELHRALSHLLRAANRVRVKPRPRRSAAAAGRRQHGWSHWTRCSPATPTWICPLRWPPPPGGDWQTRWGWWRWRGRRSPRRCPPHARGTCFSTALRQVISYGYSRCRAPLLKRAVTAFRDESMPAAAGGPALAWFATPTAAHDMWDDESCSRCLTRHVRLARESGALTLLPLVPQRPDGTAPRSQASSTWWRPSSRRSPRSPRRLAASPRRTAPSRAGRLEGPRHRGIQADLHQRP